MGLSRATYCLLFVRVVILFNRKKTATYEHRAHTRPYVARFIFRAPATKSSGVLLFIFDLEKKSLRTNIVHMHCAVRSEIYFSSQVQRRIAFYLDLKKKIATYDDRAYNTMQYVARFIFRAKSSGVLLFIWT